jgi:hypothetical protein
MKRIWCVAVACVAVSGCALGTPPIANPNGLPADALTLEYVLERGCLPYMLGHMTEQQAMRGVGLNHIQPIVPLLVPGGNAPFWARGNALQVTARVGRDICHVHIKGRNFAAYGEATKAALRRTFGAEAASDGGSGYRAWVPGQITGCRQGVRYTYYQEPKSNGFSVENYRVADCAHDPLRMPG